MRRQGFSRLAQKKQNERKETIRRRIGSGQKSSIGENKTSNSFEIISVTAHC